MKTLLMSAATAAALMLMPVAPSPVQAAELDDLVVPLLGVAILGAIVSSANSNNDNDTATSAASRQVSVNRTSHNQRHHRPQSRYARQKVLPGQCLRVLEGRESRIVFPESCLNRVGIRDRELPNRCERRVNTRNGRLDIYGARCLAQAGWELPRIARR